MITLIFGGLYQGQEEYLETHYRDFEALDGPRALTETEKFYLFPTETWFETLELKDLEKLLNENQGNLVFAGREIGSGVVPMDAGARAYRDHVGRCYQLIARRADRVVRLSMGISEVLK